MFWFGAAVARALRWEEMDEHVLWFSNKIIIKRWVRFSIVFYGRNECIENHDGRRSMIWLCLSLGVLALKHCIDNLQKNSQLTTNRPKPVETPHIIHFNKKKTNSFLKFLCLCSSPSARQTLYNLATTCIIHRKQRQIYALCTLLFNANNYGNK